MTESNAKGRAPQRRRVTGTEQYYTPALTCEYCVNKMLGVVSDRSATWLEPAGGKGAFIEALASGGITNVVPFDIHPLHRSVILSKDFLSEDLSKFNLSNCITLTNPPFGRANSL